MFKEKQIIEAQLPKEEQKTDTLIPGEQIYLPPNSKIGTRVPK